MLVSQSEQRVGEARALLWGVDLLGRDRELVPAVVGFVVGDRVTESLLFGGDQLWQPDVQGDIGRGQIEEVLPEGVERLVGQAGEQIGGVMGECREVRAGELVFGGAAVLAAAAFDFSA